MNVRRWLHEHSLKLLAIRDPPGAIAGGIAIGIFFGFTPLFGFKTLLAIFFAWLTRSNILAAVIAGTLHDVILPFMPVIYRWEYQVGYWLLSHPHHFPPKLRHVNWSAHSWRNWRSFLTVGRPLLVGGVLCAAPVAIFSFFVAHFIVDRHHKKKAALPPANPPMTE
jgi:uncharacterized protein (DUF2062 family)